MESTQHLELLFFAPSFATTSLLRSSPFSNFTTLSTIHSRHTPSSSTPLRTSSFVLARRSLNSLHSATRSSSYFHPISTASLRNDDPKQPSNAALDDDTPESEEPTSVQGPQPTQTLSLDHLPPADRTLLEATYSGDITLAETALQSQNASPKATDANRRSALHFAAANGVQTFCSKLIDAGAEVDLQDVMGLTPLHMAAGYRRLQTLNLLLEKGADPHIENLEGMVPFDLVERLLENTPRKRLFMDNPVWKTTREIYEVLDRVTEDEEEGVEDEVEEVGAGRESSGGRSSQDDIGGATFTVRKRSQEQTSSFDSEDTPDVQVKVRVKSKQK